jgi:hypothetical protein
VTVEDEGEPTMRASWCLSLLLPLAVPAIGAERSISVEPATARVSRLEKVELTLGVETVGDNPYDPTEVNLRVELRSPSGQSLVVPAFHFQPFERRRVGGREWLYPTGRAQWTVRFAPTEVGIYRGNAVLNDRAGTARSAALVIESVASKGREHGFVRVASSDPRYLAFDDGTPFFAIGQNIAFVTDSYAEVDKVRKLGENGANFARVWACAEDWGMAIEARKSAFGRSWDWNPPVVVEPDRDGYSLGTLCLKLSGEAGASLKVSPSRPVALKPATKYRLSGMLRSGGSTQVTLELDGSHPLTGRRDWAKFAHEFTTGADQRWLADPSFRLNSKGTAWLRDLSLTEAGGGPELLGEADVNRPNRGVYNEVDGFMLDRIVEAAEQHGMYLQIVLLTRDHYMAQLRRDDSRAYDEAIAFASRLARYASARWGYSTHVAVWEYFNEIDPGLPTGRFYSEVGQVFERFDVNHHLRATSVWSAPAKHYNHPRLETADHHYYIRPTTGTLFHDEVASVEAQWRLLSRHASGKPILFSEFGITDDRWQRAPQLDRDTRYAHLHSALWASALSGFASTVCHWYWDDIERRDLYSLYRPLARYAADVPWTTAELRPAPVECDSSVRVVGLSGKTAAYLWIQDRTATWWALAMEEKRPEPLNEVALSVGGLAPGRYRVSWWDTAEGRTLSDVHVALDGGPLRLRTPTFAGDVACKVEHE